MKMFKKLMAVALVGVMAVSMLTGCAAKNESDVKKALKLAGQTKGVTVEIGNTKKVSGEKGLEDIAKYASQAADDKVGEDLTGKFEGTYTGSDKVVAYIIKEQSSTEKWRTEAGKAVDYLMDNAKANNGKYTVAVESFKAKKAADKDTKYEYVIIVAEKAAQ